MVVPRSCLSVEAAGRETKRPPQVRLEGLCAWHCPNLYESFLPCEHLDPTAHLSGLFTPLWTGSCQLSLGGTHTSRKRASGGAILTQVRCPLGLHVGFMEPPAGSALFRCSTPGVSCTSSNPGTTFLSSKLPAGT